LSDPGHLSIIWFLWCGHFFPCVDSTLSRTRTLVCPL
jgi:hypothetical protein